MKKTKPMDIIENCLFIIMIKTFAKQENIHVIVNWVN